MFHRLAGALSATAVLAALLAAAGEPWKDKTASQWTQEEATRVLTHSPWGQEVKVQQTSGRLLGLLATGSEVVVEDASGRHPYPVLTDAEGRELLMPLHPEMLDAVYAVRWSSASTVQAALERLKEFSPVLADVQAVPPELSADHYVLTVRVAQPPAESGLARGGRPLMYPAYEACPPPPYLPRAGCIPAVPSPPPAVPDLFAGLNSDELRARAELRTAKKLRLKPDRVVRHGLGASEGISFFFPRVQDGQEALPAGTEWAEFVFAGGGELKVKFKLKEMQVNGKPDY